MYDSLGMVVVVVFVVVDDVFWLFCVVGCVVGFLVVVFGYVE